MYKAIRLGGVGSHANAINAAGWTVGQVETASGYEAVLWSPSGKACSRTWAVGA
jgi:hypothetical protein